MKKTGVLLTVLAVILLLFVFISFISFNQKVTEYMFESSNTSLKEIVKPNMVSFDLQISEQVKKVKTMAQYFGECGELGDDSQMALLRAAVEQNGLLRCAIAFPNGKFITNDNKNDGNVSNDVFFIEGMKGNFSISDPRPAVVDPSKTVILFTSPIIRQDEVIGTLTYSYLCDDIDKIFNLNFLDQQGQILVIKESGEPLIGALGDMPRQENVLNYFRSLCSHTNHKPEECARMIGEEGTYTITIASNGDKLLMHYDQLNYNDWIMLSMVPEKAATQTISMITQKQRELGSIIALCVLIYVIALILLWGVQQNNHDKMTGLYTLDGFKRKAKKWLKKSPDQRFVFVKLDVKNFKLINRVYDFKEGDRVIKNISNSLSMTLADRESVAARTGTDDFVLMIPFADNQSLWNLRMKFVKNFRELMGSQFTTSIEFPTGQYVTRASDRKRYDITEILEKINFAHRAAKRRNLDIIVDYEENLEREAIFKKNIEDKMATALENHEFQLYLQGKYDVNTEKICGAEALVRWEINGEIYMQPSEFVSVLEQNGFIVKVDKYMFEQAVQKIRQFIDSGCEPVPIAVNFSRCHLNNENFVQELCDIAKRYDVPCRYLEIELTESVVFGNVKRIVQLIDQLHSVGFTLSMDDFGTGYSCLGLLKDLTVDAIKMDKGFFDLASDKQRAYVVISNMIHMAQELGIKTIAEGVETWANVQMLRQLGCDVIQGYYFARPVRADEFRPGELASLRKR